MSPQEKRLLNRLQTQARILYEFSSQFGECDNAFQNVRSDAFKAVQKARKKLGLGPSRRWAYGFPVSKKT